MGKYSDSNLKDDNAADIIRDDGERNTRAEFEAYKTKIGKEQAAESRRAIKAGEEKPAVSPAPKSSFGGEVKKIVDRRLLSGLGTSVDELKKKVMGD